MTLEEFLNLISDEDVRIELQLDIDEEEEYLYTSFWLSDYRKGISIALTYEDWIIEAITFDSIMDSAEITITIKEEK